MVVWRSSSFIGKSPVIPVVTWGCSCVLDVRVPEGARSPDQTKVAPSTTRARLAGVTTLAALANPDWRIRAAAVDGLLSFGQPGVRAALALLPEAGETVRIGIARMVVHWADEELLDEFVRRCSQPASAQSANSS